MVHEGVDVEHAPELLQQDVAAPVVQHLPQFTALQLRDTLSPHQLHQTLHLLVVEQDTMPPQQVQLGQKQHLHPLLLTQNRAAQHSLQSVRHVQRVVEQLKQLMFEPMQDVPGDGPRAVEQHMAGGQSNSVVKFGGQLKACQH